MNTALLPVAFLAGALTALAPCSIALLPVVAGTGAAGASRWRPLWVALSAAASVVAFTLLLKTGTGALTFLPERFWTGFSGGLLAVVGVSFLWPSLWEKIAHGLGMGGSSALLEKAGGKSGLARDLLVGAALGPVFSTCSPTYAVILATVLPVSFAEGLGALLAYAAGLATLLAAAGWLGRSFLKKLKFAADPQGWFRRGLGAVLIIVGALIFTGWDKTAQTFLLDVGWDPGVIEQRALDAVIKAEKTQAPEAPQPVTPADARALNADYPAPDLSGLTDWTNSDPIASLNDLRGKVVLVDFWTYSCINCLRTLPRVQGWHEKYEDAGLVVLGVHAPEFAFEKIPENVRRAAKDHGRTYPLALDNAFATWRNFDNRYWPAKYLISRDGRVRYTHFGEDAYAETEAAIRALLAQGSPAPLPARGDLTDDAHQARTGETYLGSARHATNRFSAGRQAVWANPGSGAFAAPKDVPADAWWLGGNWSVYEESATADAPSAAHGISFDAAEANLVMDGAGSVAVLLDGKPLTGEGAGSDVKGGKITLDGARLYRVADFPTRGRHVLELRFSQAGQKVFAWTFG